MTYAWISANPWLVGGILVPLSAMLSWFVIALMLHFGQFGPLDLPNHRSLHQIAVPRSGGIGILCGAMLAFLVVVPPLAFWVALGSLVGVSLLDDYRPQPARVRLAVQLFAALLAVSAFAPAKWGATHYLLAVLSVVWMTNLFNFMDGANGLAGGMTGIGFAAYAVTASLGGTIDLALFSACVAAAALGFLRFNFDPARIFMGDVGSVPLGFLAAVIGLEGFILGAWPAWFPPLVFSPFIVDATVTLMRRGWRREKVWIAHREHYYQRLIRSGWSHRRLALSAYVLMFASAVSACLLISAPLYAAWTAITAWLLAYVGLLLLIDRHTSSR